MRILNPPNVHEYFENRLALVMKSCRVNSPNTFALTRNFNRKRMRSGRRVRPHDEIFARSRKNVRAIHRHE